ncbi:MAG: LamG-like jellyroll fold domain-containing protein [Verrucomicrobiales bacterium]
MGHWGSADIGWNSTQLASEWTAIAYTWDADTQTTTVYTNGVLANSATGVALDTASEDSNGFSLPFVLGNQNNADGTRTNGLNGSLTVAMVRVSNSALDSDAVLAHYQSEVGIFTQKDSDGDGIVDSVEDMFAFLDKNNPDDAAMTRTKTA